MREEQFKEFLDDFVKKTAFLTPDQICQILDELRNVIDYQSNYRKTISESRDLMQSGVSNG